MDKTRAALELARAWMADNIRERDIAGATALGSVAEALAALDEGAAKHVQSEQVSRGAAAKAMVAELLRLTQEVERLRSGRITLSALQAAHIERQEEWCPDQKPDLSFRGNEMAGEVGEACNVIKKLERERQGWRGSRATKEQLAAELADVVHTAVLCAITAGIDLEPAVIDKFNATSEKNGLASRLSPEPSPGEAGEPVAVDADWLANWRKAIRDCWDEDECPSWPVVETHVDAILAALTHPKEATPQEPTEAEVEAALLAWRREKIKDAIRALLDAQEADA